jgi:cell wall-associated NlpC family hydrolase
VYHLGRPVWSYGRGYLGDTLLPGHTLNPGQYLLSGDHGHRLFMQGDGNLVYYRPDRTAAWASNTIQPGNRAVMQADGNLVVYGGPTPRFSTGTDGHPGALLRAQNDGNLVIYDGATALWDRHTGRIGGGTTANERGLAITSHAAAYAGTRYCLGGPVNLLGSNPCVDCSALTQIAVYRAIGLLLPRTSNAQYAHPAGRPVAREDLLPGDLVFFRGEGSAVPGHVGVYAGGGEMWDAQNDGVPVARHRLYSDYIGARRFW